MSDAREIIAQAHPADIIAQAIRMFIRTEGAGRVGEIAVSVLTAAGYRILGPDEVDALDRLMARADAWPLNSDSARVSVRLGDLRALGRKA